MTPSDVLALACKIVCDMHSIFKITHLHVQGVRFVFCLPKNRGAKQQRVSHSAYMA